MRVPGFRNRNDDGDRLTTVHGTDRVTTHDGSATTLGGAPRGLREEPRVVHDTTVLRGATTHDDRTRTQNDGVNLKDAQKVVAEYEREKQAAYQRGLKDGVRTKRNNPVLTIIVLLLALLGIAVGALAIREGSFSGAGAVLDRTASIAAVEARDTGGEVAQDTGAALQSTGAAVERDAEAARR
jgi:hypothetical protein